jgi:hypothetical protein
MRQGMRQVWLKICDRVRTPNVIGLAVQINTHRPKLKGLDLSLFFLSLATPNPPLEPSASTLHRIARRRHCIPNLQRHAQPRLSHHTIPAITGPRPNMPSAFAFAPALMTEALHFPCSGLESAHHRAKTYKANKLSQTRRLIRVDSSQSCYLPISIVTTARPSTRLIAVVAHGDSLVGRNRSQ